MIKKGRLKEIVSELQGASKMHLKQSKEIEKHIDDMKAPTKQTTAGDVVGFAGNFLKGVGGVVASMLSTTPAYGGQSSPKQQEEEMRLHGDLSKEEFDRLNARQDGGPLSLPKTNGAMEAKMTSPVKRKDRTGDSVSWKYGKGTYSGTCLNASCSRARTKNDKVKILPKNRGK